MIIPQNSRIQNHCITASGSTPTIPASENFTDGTWLITDLMRGEFGINLTNDRVWCRTDNGILELATTTANSLFTYNGKDIITKTSSTAYSILPTDINLVNLGDTTRPFKDIVINGVIQVGSFTTSGLPASPRIGMIAYNSTTNKFVGFDATGSWVNLS